MQPTSERPIAPNHPICQFKAGNLEREKTTLQPTSDRPIAPIQVRYLMKKCQSGPPTSRDYSMINAAFGERTLDTREASMEHIGAHIELGPYLDKSNHRRVFPSTKRRKMVHARWKEMKYYTQTRRYVPFRKPRSCCQKRRIMHGPAQDDHSFGDAHDHVSGYIPLYPPLKTGVLNQLRLPPVRQRWMTNPSHDPPLIASLTLTMSITMKE